jgi:hypothetical protein
VALEPEETTDETLILLDEDSFLRDWNAVGGDAVDDKPRSVW